MGTQRERILAVDDQVYEYVEVPEWGEKIRIRSLTINEQRTLMERLRLRTGNPADDGEYVMNRDKFVPQVLITCCVDDNGEPLFEQADADALVKKSGAAIGRLMKVATRLAGLSDDDQVQEAMDDLKETASDA